MHVMATPALAFVVSPHGFGHAARACAVIQAVADRRPDLRFEIFTTVPVWFFAQSLTVAHTVHPVLVDVGLAQRTPLEADLDATVRSLDALLAPPAGTVDRLAASLKRLGCRVVVCDIAPLGIAAAHQAGVPAVLVENFTWDWIYRPFAPAYPRLGEHGRLLGRLVATADLRLQAEPVCAMVQGAATVAPISRRPRLDADTVRRRLDVAPATRLVLVSMGGVRWRPGGLERLRGLEGCLAVVAGAGGDRPRRDGSLLALPFASRHYHPDLVAASDLVVAKLGYSTVAEAYHAGTSLAYVARPSFPESAVLARFAEATMAVGKIAAEDVTSGAWVHLIDDLRSDGRERAERANGADEAAARILDLLV